MPDQRAWQTLALGRLDHTPDAQSPKLPTRELGPRSRRGRFEATSRPPCAAAYLRVLAAQAGASVGLVQTHLAHKDPALTLRLYQHLFDDDLDASRHGLIYT